MKILLITWAFPHATVPTPAHQYRIVLDERGANCPPGVTIERLCTAAAGEDVWRPIVLTDLDHDTLFACAMARLAEMTLDWGKRIHDFVRDTQVPPSDGSQSRYVPYLNRQTEVLEYRKEKLPRSEMNMLPPKWAAREDGTIVIYLGTFQGAL